MIQMIMTWNLYLNFDIMKSKLKFQPQNCDMNGGLFSVNETTNSGNKTLLNSIQFTTSASILIDFCLVRRLIVI
jgi:ABC-type glycerol-3-phosphate transport system permease component